MKGVRTGIPAPAEPPSFSNFMQGKQKERGIMKRIKRTFGLMLATLIVMLAPAAAAQADPFHLDITDAVLDLGGLEGVRAIDSTLDPPDPPATLDGDLTAGEVTIPKAGFVFPEKEAVVSDPITAKINMEANEDITGTYDEATGKLVLDTSLKATVEIDALSSTCVISPIDISLSTDNRDPYLGVEFGSGLSGTGAVGAAWDALPPVTGGGQCSLVAGLIAGPGGIWMSQDIVNPETCDTDPDNIRCEGGPVGVPSVAPRIISGPDSVTESKTAEFKFTKGAGETKTVDGFRCSLDGSAFEPCDSGSKTYSGLTVGSHTFKVKSHNSTGDGPEASKTWTVSGGVGPGDVAKFGPLKIMPAKKTIKRGKKASLTAKISNVGGAVAKGVKICVKAPKKLVSVKKCVKIGSVAAGATKSAKFKVTVKKKAKKGKKATLKFSATGSGLKKKTATAKVKVK